MRTISPWDITDIVNKAINTGRSIVHVSYFASPRVVTAITVGRDHNHLPPGHYVFVEHETEGQQLVVSIKVVPVLSTYTENATVTTTFIGHTLAVNDSEPCMIFQLEAAPQPSLASIPLTKKKAFWPWKL